MKDTVDDWSAKRLERLLETFHNSMSLKRPDSVGLTVLSTNPPLSREARFARLPPLRGLITDELTEPPVCVFRLTRNPRIGSSMKASKSVEVEIPFSS
jgi:hypothetical protein